MNIYVSNLSFNVTDEDLNEYFAEYGEVSSAKVILTNSLRNHVDLHLLKCQMKKLQKKQSRNWMALL